MRIMRRLIGLTLLLSWSSTSYGQTTTAPSELPSTSAVPSSIPTEGPSDAILPTIAPTFVGTTNPPTLMPTNATEAPTLNPTTSPTGLPSVTPSVMPSVVPSATPSANLVETTQPPTESNETLSPTLSPTSVPTASNETDSPTLAPSTSFPPSMAPVMNETALPTSSPVTATPSSTPSLMPSAAPTTMAPTRSVAPTSSTKSPTLSPVVATESPTTIPTIAPSPVEGETITLTIRGLQLNLVGVGELNAAAQTVFMSVTKQFYEGSVYNDDGRRRLQAVQGVSDFATTVRYRGQEVGAEGNTVEYEQDIEYVSTTQATPLDVIRQPFNDATLSSIYVEELRSQGGESFAGLTSVEAPVVVAPRSDDDDGLGTGAIVGIIVGAVALCAIGLFIVMRSNNNDGHEQLNERENSPPATFSALQSEEVSTMDDHGLNRAGTGESGSILDVGDQSVATVDYDYSKAYGGADQSVVSSAGGTMGENTRETGSALQTSARAALGASFDSEGKPDANVREEVLEINAPAGKLGVVIDTPDEGAPVVHAVKDSSVIADLIQVGDKLVAVDDEDVTAMTAIKVSKLISKKSANPSRKLTIIRQVVVDE